jgi:Domain of unknown function (DUF4190)
VPTDQPGHLTVEEAPPKASPIENELATYRAISNRAIFSVICGILASFSFADLIFLVFAVLAVVLGVTANLAIKRKPDVLTGTRLANVGITLGLLFGLTVTTYTAIQSFILGREASKFAQVYAKVLKEGSLGDALLYRDPKEAREKTTAAEKEKEYHAMRAREKMMVEQKMAPLVSLRKALAPKDAHLHFVDIETKGMDSERVGGVYYYATALYEVEKPGEAGTPQYALALFKGQQKGRHYDWWVENVLFPYRPKSYQATPKPVDDGHGHGPGGH